MKQPGRYHGKNSGNGEGSLPKLLDKMNHKAEFDEDLIRKYHALIDLEEFKAREKLTINGKQSD